MYKYSNVTLSYTALQSRPPTKTWGHGHDSSPSAPRLPPHPESLLTFDIAIGGKEHASTLSESFGRFVDLPAPGSPRECHGLGNLRGDEAWEEERNGQGLTSEQNNVIRRTGADFRVWNGGEERSRRVGRPITYGGSVETAGRGRSVGPGSANGGGGETADTPRNEAGGGARGRTALRCMSITRRR